MAARLRKAFRYPEDSDESEREGLDEVEQEQVIEQLKRQNDTRNEQYNMIFTGIPLVSVLAFFPSLWSAASFSERFCSLISVVSLLATGYTMRNVPLRPDIKGKKPLSIENERLDLIRTALIPANGTICGLLALYFLVGTDSSVSSPTIYLIPGVLTMMTTAMLGAIMLARQVMLSVDLTALQDLQYEYKGA
ncbi:hypothetical protein N7478_006736 [Penicillium angulare]|uniref:uncharacterized protein n=1 Tax=Penicillium angulare TaxID=116970 RepID=UPI0025424EDC|nr:uncharacterized protein N7478_006736 [Penicillium angulare]KAJ5281364.1 hypothetical protein N7478_006736 [Penicillium angulare]